jgi:hypothetical protein
LLGQTSTITFHKPLIIALLVGAAGSAAPATLAAAGKPDQPLRASDLGA